MEKDANSCKKDENFAQDSSKTERWKALIKIEITFSLPVPMEQQQKEKDIFFSKLVKGSMLVAHLHLILEGNIFI